MQKYKRQAPSVLILTWGEELFKKIDKEFKVNMNILDVRCTKISGLSRAYGLITFYISHLIY
jgi:hypothetical protein